MSPGEIKQVLVLQKWYNDRRKRNTQNHLVPHHWPSQCVLESYSNIEMEVPIYGQLIFQAGGICSAAASSSLMTLSL